MELVVEERFKILRMLGVFDIVGEVGEPRLREAARAWAALSSAKSSLRLAAASSSSSRLEVKVFSDC